ncbi:hypothetical protein SKAU_G00209050 [Synaphobranchus kaupii]|uniref:Peptidase A2 domain-containing protein n=1 Tax=Synaphobranchus kaupii TaxID=118154 RepID=A0A9Q1F8Z3_SYNKA|nr:hypothetical protein SKAU_G00209050 [Synaphobranchus kaupii]
MDSADSSPLRTVLDCQGALHNQSQLDAKSPNNHSLLSASLLVNGLIQVVSVLVDSGADDNFIDADLVSKSHLQSLSRLPRRPSPSPAYPSPASPTSPPW